MSETRQRYLVDENRYSFLYEGCPLNAVDQWHAAVGAARADQALEAGTKLGKPRSELGEMIAAC